MNDTEFLKTFQDKLEDFVYFIVKNLSSDEKKELIKTFKDGNLIGDEGVITLMNFDMKKIPHQNAFLTLIIKNYLIFNLIQLSIKQDELTKINNT